MTPARAARDEAEAMLARRPSLEIAVYTDSASVQRTVLVALAIRGRCSVVVAVDAAEWDGTWLLQRLP